MKPDIVLIMLGSCDSWDHANSEEFKKEAEFLISSI
jgi:hypothetical protein